MIFGGCRYFWASNRKKCRPSWIFFTKIQFYSHKILKNGPICTKLVSMIKFFHAGKFEKKNQNGRHLEFPNLANQLFLVRKKA